MREAKTTLMLLENIIIKDYHKKRTTINLFFTINALTNKLIKCDINHSIKNFLDYLFVETCVKLHFVKEFTRRFRRD